MALISCPECKKEVSDTTISCPHCGFKIKKEKTKSLKSIHKGNILSKITLTNISAIVIQVILISMLFVEQIKVVFIYYNSETYNGYKKSVMYSMANLSFIDINKYLSKILEKKGAWYDFYDLRINNVGFSGAQIGFVILIVLFVVIICMLVFEFVKNKLLFNVLFSSIVAFITEIYAIIFYNVLTNISGEIVIMESWNDNPDYLSDKFYASGPKVFIILCIVLCLIKMINYWLHYENKTEVFDTLSFLKKVKGKSINKINSIIRKNNEKEN